MVEVAVSLTGGRAGSILVSRRAVSKITSVAAADAWAAANVPSLLAQLGFVTDYAPVPITWGEGAASPPPFPGER
jgi:hypothetical protein